MPALLLGNLSVCRVHNFLVPPWIPMFVLEEAGYWICALHWMFLSLMVFALTAFLYLLILPAPGQLGSQWLTMYVVGPFLTTFLLPDILYVHCLTILC